MASKIFKIKDFINERYSDEFKENFSFETENISKLNRNFKYFHLSAKYLGDTFEFTPRIPKEPYYDSDQNIIEDDITPRVSLAHSVEDALNALEHETSTGYYFIYVSNDDSDIEFTAQNIQDCPESENNKYGISFRLKKWVIANLIPEEREEDDEYVDSILSKIKNLSPSKLNKEFENNLGDEFKGCVPDANDTNEVWKLKPIKMFCVGYIDQYKGEDRYYLSNSYINLT